MCTVALRDVELTARINCFNFSLTLTLTMAILSEVKENGSGGTYFAKRWLKVLTFFKKYPIAFLFHFEFVLTFVDIVVL